MWQNLIKRVASGLIKSVMYTKNQEKIKDGILNGEATFFLLFFPCSQNKSKI